MAKPQNNAERSAVQAMYDGAAPSFRTEMEAYETGKTDFHRALATGQPLRCTLIEAEQRENALVRKWVQGANHAELALKAHTPVVKIQVRDLARKMGPK